MRVQPERDGRASPDAALDAPIEPGDADAPDAPPWHLAVVAGGVGSFDWDLTTGTLVWDEQLLRMFGYAREDFGRTIEDFDARLHPGDVARVHEALEDAIARCGTYEAEYRVVRPDGVTRWVRARGTAVAGPDGAATRVLGVAYDTTAERASDARLTRVLETMSAAFYSLDRDWRFTYVNAEAERLLGRRRDELLGGDIWELFPAALDSPFEEHYRGAVRTGEPAVFEAYYPAPLDGWYELRAWPNPDGLSVYFLDVTARRAAQVAADDALVQAEEASRRLELLARVSADLGASLDLEATLATLGEQVVPVLADWCVITLVDEHGMRDIAAWHADPAMQPVLDRYAAVRVEALEPGAFLTRTAATGRPTTVPAPAADAVAAVLRTAEARALIHELAPHTAAAIPLRARGRTAGVISLFRGPDRPALAGGDLLTAVELGERAGMALDNARLYDQQHRIAEGLQRSLLTAPVQPDPLEVVVRYQPASQAARVGGDWYDAFLQPDGATVVVIGDVMGHDVEATAAMSQVRSLLRGIGYATGAPPATILTTLDAAMRGLQVDTTATAVVARVERVTADGATRTVLRWSNAGHPAPFLLGPDGSVTALDAHGNDLLLGVAPAWPRTDHEVELAPGAALLLYTDGLVERRGEVFSAGSERLRTALAELAGADLDALVDGVLERMVPGGQADDVAVLAVRHRPH